MVAMNPSHPDFSKTLKLMAETPGSAARPTTDTRLLVVDDHDILREGLQILLETEGYRVLTAANGVEALQKMQTIAPDLILSDISMPEMDGYQFYEAVRARSDWLAIPFIFLTALGERDEVFASRRLGAEDYLVKPVDRQELLTSIRSRLERSQKLLLFQYEQAYEATLIMLANAIEQGDQYTGGHVERVKNYAHEVALILGLSEAEKVDLRFGAILHDIGKIHIPESILRKPGRLDADEWEEMKRHTLYGVNLLAPIAYLQGAIPIIRSHHERWDGSGYPDGLKSHDIPTGARIVSVVDAFDAMTTDRVYHSARPPKEVLSEILRSSGQCFDSQVVEAFLSIF